MSPWQTILAAITSYSTAIAPIQPAIVTGLLGLFGVLLTRRVTKGQLLVQQQTLFVSILERRITWQKSFRDAVKQWDDQMPDIIHDKTGNPPPPTGLFAMGLLLSEARWLFGNEVAARAKDVDDQAKVLVGVRIKAAGGNREAAEQVGPAMSRMYDLFEPLSDAIKPYLYLGDIKRPTSVVKTPMRLKGMTYSAGKAIRDK